MRWIPLLALAPPAPRQEKRVTRAAMVGRDPGPREFGGVGFSLGAKKYSPAGTRTRVSWVKTRYPDHLDYRRKGDHRRSDV